MTHSQGTDSRRKGSARPALKISAGPRAAALLRESGFEARHFSWLAGASGGPKWFVLYGLDRYLAGQFFNNRQTPLHMIGSSAGAWRLACYAHRDPVSALVRLAEFYSQQVYSDRPDAAEVTAEASRMLAAVLDANGAEEIATNTVMRLHIIADRVRGPLKLDCRLPLGLGLATCAAANLASRRTLAWFFERYVFHNKFDDQHTLPLDDLPSRYVALRPENVRQALMASGSIPFVMQAVRDVAGASGQVFRDGGITDYHLDLPFHQSSGLVLYPHFYTGITPGWFDRMTPWRTATPGHFDNVVLLTPSREFVASLPYGKISDRKDFERLDAAERLRYWQIVLKESERLADELQELVETGKGLERIEAFSPRRVKHA